MKNRRPLIRVSDARRVLRLMAQLVELRHDPLVWFADCIDRLPAVVGAEAIVWGQIGLPLPGVPAPGTYIAYNRTWTSTQLAIMFECFANAAPLADPLYRRVLEMPSRFVAIHRRDAVTDEEWYGSEIFQRYLQPAGVDEIINMRVISPILRCCIPVSLYRFAGSKPMTQRNVAILRFFGQELFRKLEGDARSSVDKDLPEREYEVLQLLREGLSEKEVAQRLDLSRHTIHDYCKSLYQRYEVHSRAELLASVHRIQLAQSIMRLPRELPAGTPWGFTMGHAELS